MRDQTTPATRRRNAALRIALGAMSLAVAFVLLLRGVPPVPTWFYVFAWYPTLVLLDGLASLLEGTPSLFARPTLALSLLLWSPVVWLVFEAANFRLQNWYYVLLPARGIERWAGIVLSFATVVPAVVLAERVLSAAGVFRLGTGPRILVRAGEMRWAVALGVAMGALALAWPQLFFPLVWGSAFLLAEPVVYARTPELSLFRDVELGQWGRIGRLLLGGLGIGVLWESFNSVATSRWIYTVPWLEELKVFEMPPFGFVGFPVFALEAWAMYAALAALRVAVPVLGESRVRGRRTLVGALLAALFAAAVLWGMERRTISSVTAGAGSEPVVAALAGLRGMGVRHARALIGLGVGDPCALSLVAAEPLALTVREMTGHARPTAAEVRVWVRAAKLSCARSLEAARR